jgi:hypothetical protein
MPRIIVTTEASQLPPDAAVLLDEQVQSVHISTGHAAAQLVQRLAWAISDAEDAEHERPEQRAQPRQRARGATLSARPAARMPIGA